MKTITSLKIEVFNQPQCLYKCFTDLVIFQNWWPKTVDICQFAQVVFLYDAKREKFVDETEFKCYFDQKNSCQFPVLTSNSTSQHRIEQKLFCNQVFIVLRFQDTAMVYLPTRDGFSQQGVQNIWRSEPLLTDSNTKANFWDWIYKFEGQSFYSLLWRYHWTYENLYFVHQRVCSTR